MSLAPKDPWEHLAALTPARVALGRAGSGLPTRELLRFELAHAQARDAVGEALDATSLRAELLVTGLPVLHVTSRAADRRTYLQRPDLGRRLDEASARELAAAGGTSDLAVVIADGLSALAVLRYAAPTVAALLPLLDGLRIAPLVLATQGRVALADEVGALLGARLALILLGERPGLSSPDSLGAYLTFAPRVGCLDSQRNCVSNIRSEGLPPDRAARKLAWLIREALRRELTGVGLTDESERALPPAALPENRPTPLKGDP
ncbi:MAG TPA: ethanolamine ammonia-lyase subunit EutC [Thermoanaerobaculia bacterium]